MSREKQIEEMAKVIEQRCKRDCLPSCDECIAETLYYAGYRKQEWISVNERLPEKNKTCLCTDGIYIGTVYYSGRVGLEDYAPFDQITHWMPLPEAPKGGAE